MLWAAPGSAGARESNPVVYPDILVTARDLRDHLSARTAGGVNPDTTAGRWRMLDVRSGNPYREGHIPGALWLDVGEMRCKPDALISVFQSHLCAMSERDTVVCYADAQAPALAGKAFWFLELAGFPTVKVLNGGFEAWLAAGGETETHRSTSAAPKYAGQPDTTRIADFDYVLGHFGRTGTTILDGRSPEEWAKGHIPHSLPFPLETLVGEDGLWLSGKEMRARFAVWGPRDREYVDLDDEFIVLGDDPYGHQPIHPYLAARLAGIEHVRVYPDGFSGWRSKDNAPITRLINVGTLRDRFRRERGKDFRTIDLPPADFILLDLRGERDWQIGHIPGAIEIAPHQLNEQIEALVATYWPGADRATIPVVVYCYGPTCTRSRWGTTFAAQHGFLKLEWFKDGVQGWRQAGEKLISSR